MVLTTLKMYLNFEKLFNTALTTFMSCKTFLCFEKLFNFKNKNFSKNEKLFNFKNIKIETSFKK